MLSEERDGRAWRVGTQAEVAWIVSGTSPGLTITAAIPPVFESYATIVLPARDAGQSDAGQSDAGHSDAGHSDAGQEAHDRAVLALLSEYSAGQPWWLGYLDTGADDIVFRRAPMVALYSGWHYVLVEAGPEQAGSWRQRDFGSFWKGVMPNVLFPADRSWLVSTLWDDDWTCVGGPAGLVAGFCRHPDLRARPVALGQDATPPGHQAH